MSVHFNEQDWIRTKRNYRAWWAGELDRPLIAVTMGGYESDRPDAALPGRKFASFHPPEVTADAIVDRWDSELAHCRFPGDAFPSVFPNFGPGVVAAFLGCHAENGVDTVWFHPERESEIGDLHLTFKGEAPWFKRIADIERAAVNHWKGRVQVGMTDLGGNLDIVASFRPGEKLLLDLCDHPDQVKRVRDEAHEEWWKAFDALNKIMCPPNPGYTAWASIFSEEPYYMLQCDFAYMIGPDMFDEFVKPELESSCRKLKNAFYHLDGIGQLPHLDSLLAIPELKGIQWIPGSGQPDVSHWPEVYRKIRKAGKLIQVYDGQYAGGLKIVDVLAEQLGDATGIIVLGWADRAQEKDVDSLLRKYKAI